MAVTNTWTIGQLEYNNDSDNGVVIAAYETFKESQSE